MEWGYNTVSATILYRLRRNGMGGSLSPTAKWNGGSNTLSSTAKRRAIIYSILLIGAQAISYYPYITYQQNPYVAQKLSEQIQLMDKLQPGKSLIPYGS